MDWSHELGLSGEEALISVVTAGGIYAAAVLFTRLARQRSIASFATFDFVVTIATGAIVGRTVLIRTSLAGGVLALGSLFAIQALVGFVRNRRGTSRLLDNPAVLLMTHAEVLHHNLRRARITHHDLREQLRLNGVHRLEEVGAAVMERNGEISVLRRGAISEWLVEDLPAADRARIETEAPPA
jgi:uncharacterized membrane protein YcaP (DUF421 family)